MLELLAERYCVFIKTEIPPDVFAFLPENCSLIPEQVDAGCVQQNFVQVDVARSFQNLAGFYQRREEAIKKEARWLEENGIDLIVCDISSQPLKAARELGIPALLVANFTWLDIYSEFPDSGQHSSLLDLLKEEYACASLHIQPQCFLRRSVAPRQEETGIISLKGKDIRNPLEQSVNQSFENKTVVFVYLGMADASQVQWRSLADLEDCVFLTRDPIPAGFRPRNLAVLNEQFRFPDLIASSDVVLTKAGYSTLATAFTHGKPVLSCARDDFCEFGAMKEFMETRGVGLLIPPDDFFACRWRDYIEKSRNLSVKGKVRLNGAEDVVRIADRYLNAG